MILSVLTVGNWGIKRIFSYQFPKEMFLLNVIKVSQPLGVCKRHGKKKTDIELMKVDESEMYQTIFYHQKSDKGLS